ncbi:PREDICTED: uncharacterized protein LOC104815067 [Tarenaya hassleriana]|uniref:uncharacterized protein LOC104815067 n=1 Tax=Tarenaya hassleriana TaxID=28532 RepID=UPI00053C7A74|nr:PREDICTED: uncharacterized protein LOC104815067 [Tarenaya hassleriana]
MGNCLTGKRNEAFVEEEVKKDHRRKDRKVKIILTKDELEKLIMFQLEDGGGALSSIADFLRDLEAERSATEVEARRRWRPSLERIME